MKKTFLIALIILFNYSFSFADTEVSGLITEDTTWTKENSPYIILGKVGVDYQVTLTIEPGVQVKSGAGQDYYIKVMGKIIAVGTETNLISFTVLEENQSEYPQHGVEFDTNKEGYRSWEGSRFEWCEFSGQYYCGIHSQIAFNSEEPLLTVGNCKFSNIGGSGIWFQIHSLIRDSYFTNCGKSYVDPDCIVTNNGAVIENNIIENNYGSGISGSDGIISGNIIINNKGSGITASNTDIFNNVVINNGENGILCSESTLTYNIIINNGKGVRCSDSTLTHNLIGNNSIGINGCANVVNYNNLIGNKEYNYEVTEYKPYAPQYSECSDTDATNNWWGTAKENEIAQSIYDYYDDFELYEVIYTPWLTEPDPNVPTTTSSSSTSSTTTSVIITTTTSFLLTTTSTINSSTTTSTSPQPCISESLYGENSAETEFLRYISDNVLSTTPEGQEIIRLYYEWSPIIVNAMEEDAAFKAQVKEMIDEVVDLIGRELQ